jgi:RHS repeat-associated protein
VVSATYGDGIVRTNTYDKMGRPTEIQDGTTSSPTYRLYITYYGNGSVKTFNDTVSGSYTFTYDAFNRLVSSTNTAQSYSWTYDQFGNRWHQDKTAGTGYTVDLSFNNNNNRITTSGYSYDAAGNLLKDGSACNPCWQYDDNGNLVSSSYGSSATSYSYDALGRRVEKIAGGTTYDFVLDGSNPLDEYQGSVWPTAWSRTTGGVFTYANGTTYFNRTDDLGTPRVSTDYTAAVKRTETMGPFGDGFTESFAGLDFTGFAGGVWDQENNGDHFGAREYAKTQGRWLTPDPAGLAAVDPSNPQSWNRYAYVMNNPVSFIDPTGLACWPLEKAMFGSCAPFMNDGVTFGSNWYEFDYLLYASHGAVFIDGGCFGCEEISAGLLTDSTGGNAAANNGPQKACPAVPAHPANANVNSNISETNFVYYANWLNPPTQAAFTDAWLVSQVRPNGPWDYKTQGQQYDAFGNFNFGATGGAAGIPLQVLQAGAGAVSTLVGTNSSQYGSWYQPPLHGHAPIKSDMIAAGYAYYQQGCK